MIIIFVWINQGMENEMPEFGIGKCILLLPILKRAFIIVHSSQLFFDVIIIFSLDSEH